MPYLFFDTETTGLPLWRQPSDHPDQPRIIQLAAILHDDDGRERASMSTLIKPDGWRIPPVVTDLTGITQEDAKTFGVPIDDALGMFSHLALGTGVKLVAHNARFDKRMLRIELLRRTFPLAPTTANWLKEEAVFHCTADMADPIVNLPPTEKMIAAGFGNKPKRCKLSEAVRHFFDEDLEGAHDALVDVRACARIFWHMRGLQGGAA